MVSVILTLTVDITCETFVIWVAILFLLKLAWTNIPFYNAAIFNKTISLYANIPLDLQMKSYMPFIQCKRWFTKYGRVLAHDNFKLIQMLTHRNIFIVSQSEVIHTA